MRCCRQCGIAGNEAGVIIQYYGTMLGYVTLISDVFYASATKHLGIGMLVGRSVSTQLSNKLKMCSFNNTFPAKAYSV